MLLPVVAASCGDGPTAAPPGLEPSPADVVFTLPTDSVVVTARRDGVPVGGLSLSVQSEAAEVEGLKVLARDALGRGVLRAAGPGTAVVTVRSGEAEGRIQVTVAPPGPTVFGAVVTSRAVGPDTVSLLGSHLDRVTAAGAVRVAGNPVTVIQRSAGALRFLAPTVDPVGCAGGAPEGSVEIQGAVLAPGLTVPVARTGEVRLGVGDYALLGELEAGCVRLPAAAGEYVLAYADLREESRARTEWGGFPPGDYSVSVVDRTVAAVPSPAARGVGGDGPAFDGDDPPPSSSFEGCSDYDFVAITFWCRSKPWVVGDSMRLREPGAPDTVTATVWRVYGSRFVFAVVDGDDSANLRAFKVAIDAAMPRFLQTAVPLLQSVFGSTEPSTSAGSGQLLTVIGDFQHSSVGGGCCVDGLGVWSAVALGSWHPNWESEIFYLLTHEFTHTWQRRWYYDTRPPGGSTSAGSTLALEGGADLLTLEAVRRYAGVSWGANRGLFSFTDGANPDGPLLKELAAAGDLFAGYEHGSSFLRDIVARVVSAGAPIDDAYRAVALGALEGWHGWDEQGAKRPGLTERVRAAMGSDSWEPAEALLLYTLSQGADDLTSSQVLRNPFYRRAGVEPLGTGFGATVVRGGTGGSAGFVRGGTSVGLVRLVDGGGGSSFELSANQPSIGWAIARVK